MSFPWRRGFPGGGGGGDRVYRGFAEGETCDGDSGGGGCTCKVGTVGPLPTVHATAACSISKDRNLGNGFIIKNCIVEADPGPDPP